MRSRADETGATRANVIAPRPSTTGQERRRAAWIGRAALYSVTAFLTSAFLGTVTSLLWLATPISGQAWFVTLHQAVLGLAFLSGAALFLVLFVCQRFLVPPKNFYYSSVGGSRVHVGLTAYNDEACVGDAVREFKACPLVHRVVVVENNSRDRTVDVARSAEVDAVITEPVPGYGSCCMRAMAEAAAGLNDNDVVVLCEGDMTFSANDVAKFLAYVENCDLVLGTRTTQELRESRTQMDWLINPANQILAKLIQTRFWGTRLTDCGCTYRAMRVGSYRRLRETLHVRGNHFSPHMYIEALKLGMRVVEIPVVFRHRAGTSKGVGSNKVKAARVALRMLGLLYRA